MNTHELPSTLAATSQEVSMAIIYVLCAIILLAPVVMAVVAVLVGIRAWRRTSAEKPAPTRRGVSEPAPTLGDQPRSSVHG
jgi:hypothetical protein